MKDYVVLTAARDVAAQRSPGRGKIISLTDVQAEHPLRIGHIALKPAEVPDGETPDTSSADAAQVHDTLTAEAPAAAPAKSKPGK